MISTNITDWTLTYGGLEPMHAKVPFTLYSVLFDHGKMDDPYYRLNEKAATVLSEKGCITSSSFAVTEEMLSKKHLYICFHGLDTLCEVFLNGELIISADNMHRSWRAEIKDKVSAGENKLMLKFASPSEYITQKQKEKPLYNTTSGGSTMEGIAHLRKSFCMFGWDWGPMLPDMGIYRGVTVSAFDTRIEDTEITQIHENGKVFIHLKPALTEILPSLSGRITLIFPDGKKRVYTAYAESESIIEIESPKLWWPNGLGAQPLYGVKFELMQENKVIDSAEKSVGLRTLTVSREKDEYGEEFCFCVNGKKFFSMGADYIPEDALIARRSPERTEALIKACKEANFNTVRVWGGGFYPDEWFYELCDKYGLVVWQDFMVACANILLTEEFEANFRAEATELVKRVRHHACLGLFCGNNEMELALTEWSSCIPKSDARAYADYLRLYEDILPGICREYAPEIFYWPASPSSGGKFKDPNNENIGDTHYWKVWHGGVVFEEYRKHYFRFCSEFGFEAFPDMKTLRSFALPEDMSLLSDVMRSHQKCLSGNEKILRYIKDYYKIPEDFSHFVYLSQLLQADAIRYGTEHFRRFRGRCMGAVYWQLNDCWPTVSWASLDYFGRWKALNYKAKRFFAPLLISVHEEDGRRIANVSNETLSDARVKITLKVKNNAMQTLGAQTEYENVGSLSSKDICIKETLSALIDEAPNERFLEYSLETDTGYGITDGKIYVKPKDYRFEEPHLSSRISERNGKYYIDITAEKYAKNVMISFGEAEIFPEDNFFDITDGHISVPLRAVKAEIEKANISLISVFDTV